MNYFLTAERAEEYVSSGTNFTPSHFHVESSAGDAQYISIGLRKQVAETQNPHGWRMISRTNKKRELVGHDCTHMLYLKYRPFALAMKSGSNVSLLLISSVNGHVRSTIHDPHQLSGMDILMVVY